MIYSTGRHFGQLRRHTVCRRISSSDTSINPCTSFSRPPYFIGSSSSSRRRSCSMLPCQPSESRSVDQSHTLDLNRCALGPHISVETPDLATNPATGVLAAFRSLALDRHSAAAFDRYSRTSTFTLSAAAARTHAAARHYSVASTAYTLPPHARTHASAHYILPPHSTRSHSMLLAADAARRIELGPPRR